MRKIFLVLLFIFSLCNICFARNIVTDIRVVVTLNDDGSADVIQTWTGTFTEGSENYISCENMDYSISNFKVKENNSYFYDLGTEWNINVSNENKKHKSGLHKTSKGYEMCWGIGDYGEHTYELSYHIDPLVKSFIDYDGFNFEFIVPGDNTPTTGEVIVYFEDGDINLNQENTKAWGFGYEGQVEFWNNAVHFYTQKDLQSNDSMIIMMRFNKDMIYPTTAIDKTFDEGIKNKAFEGSEYQENNLLNTIKFGLIIINFIIIWVLTILGSNWILGLFMSIWSTGFVSAGLFMGLPAFALVGFGVMLFFLLPGALKQIQWKSRFSRVEYGRDVPKNEELFMAYKCISPNRKQLKIKVDNLVASMMMVMVKKGYLEPVKEEKTRLLGGVKEEINLKLAKEPTENIYKDLYSLLQKASGSDGILQKNEIKRIGLEHCSRIESLLRLAEAQGEDDCEDNNLGNPSNLSSLTDDGIKYIANLIGLKKYFKDFTLLNERDIQEVHNWEGMLIYATLLDEAKKVMERLKIMYPENTEIQTYVNTVHVCHDFGVSLNSGINAYKAAQAAASAASGSGGHSSHSGGGGHSGGGHSGSR